MDVRPAPQLLAGTRRTPDHHAAGRVHRPLAVQHRVRVVQAGRGGRFARVGDQPAPAARAVRPGGTQPATTRVPVAAAHRRHGELFRRVRRTPAGPHHAGRRVPQLDGGRAVATVHADQLTARCRTHVGPAAPAHVDVPEPAAVGQVVPADPARAGRHQHGPPVRGARHVQTRRIPDRGGEGASRLRHRPRPRAVGPPGHPAGTRVQRHQPPVGPAADDCGLLGEHSGQLRRPAAEGPERGDPVPSGDRLVRVHLTGARVDAEAAVHDQRRHRQPGEHPGGRRGRLRVGLAGRRVDLGGCQHPDDHGDRRRDGEHRHQRHHDPPPRGLRHPSPPPRHPTGRVRAGYGERPGRLRRPRWIGRDRRPAPGRPGHAGAHSRPRGRPDRRGSGPAPARTPGSAPPPARR